MMTERCVERRRAFGFGVTDAVCVDGEVKPDLAALQRASGPTLVVRAGGGSGVSHNGIVHVRAEGLAGRRIDTDDAQVDVRAAIARVDHIEHPPVGRTLSYRKYPPEFQRDDVAMVLDKGRSIGVVEGTLGNWVAKARKERSAGTGVTADERAQNTVLRAENTQLRMERDLLKRSLAFWVKESTS